MRPPLLAALLLALPALARAQLTEPQLADLRRQVGGRIEAATILGGDYGFSGATFKVARSDNLSISKFGGAGDLGKRPLGIGDLQWQPRLQGTMGFLDAKTPSKTTELLGSEREIRSFSIQFGGGGRFWLTEHFNVAPTIVGMYGHAKESFDPHDNQFAASIVPQARAQGLIDWQADTWTFRPGTEVQYRFLWRNTIFKLTSNPVYYRTRSFWTSNPGVSVNGESGTWTNEFDADVGLGVKLWNRELRTGGRISREEILGDLRDGLNGLNHIYEVHPRLVLDFVDKWPLRWIGLGGSYLWGNNDLNGYSYGLDVAFLF